MASPEDLSERLLEDINPKFIFFPHWSAIVPEPIVQKYECVCFHMTDLPFGRGGSPLQNLVVRGMTSTRLTALRMDEGVDTGPIYGKRDLSLEGSARQVYRRAAEVSIELMKWIVLERPMPTAQEGEATAFRRRRPRESALPSDLGALETMRFIQMLDADGYPRAFVEHGEWRLEFDEASMDEAGLTATVRFKLMNRES